METISIELGTRTPKPTSRPTSLAGSRAASVRSVRLSTDRHQMMINFIYTRLTNANFFLPQHKIGYSGRNSASRTATPAEDDWRGVLLRRSGKNYAAKPVRVPHFILQAIQELNVEIAFTMCNDTTNNLFDGLDDTQDSLVFPSGARYQIIDSIEDITTGNSGRVKKFQYCCIVRRERIVLVWHDEISALMSHAERVEENLVSIMWGESVSHLFPKNQSRVSSLYGLPSAVGSTDVLDKRTSFMASSFGDVYYKEDPDSEKGPQLNESVDRPLVFTSAVLHGLAVALLIVLVLGAASTRLIGETLLDGNYIRFALLAVSPVIFAWGLFFASSIFTSFFQICGPVSSAKSNSRYYSAQAPNIAAAIRLGFTPEHITIQMPVYKEGLQSVIKPTVASLKAALSQYELRGGTANIFVNDDGLQLISPEDAEERIQFYRDNNIGWVARPPHGKDGYIRAGKFKKASNMNYALNISNRVDELVMKLTADVLQRNGVETISDYEHEALYKQALETVLADKRNEAWAEGDIRVGRYILIVDSDTRVPADCLIYGAAEMFLNPEVAIIQHNAGVMQVSGDYFENAVTYFTNLIYSAMRFAVASGEVAPFIGHNSFLRFEAIQAIATKNPDGTELYWSESHVSEDFDIALRLQVQGNVVRMASYHGSDFKEGVSLTIYDELARWEKYAYGCNELVFHPFYQWIYKGPITPLFCRFVFSNMQWSSKLSITGYIGTYYALAFALPLTLANYFLIGWLGPYLDHWYVDSWQVWLSVVAVFNILGPVALAVLRYRLGEKGFISAFWENFRWVPVFTIFFGGISFHIFLALCAHAFSINMEWGATAKEKTFSNFFKEMPKIAKSFKWMYLFTIPCLGGLIYLSAFAPPGWRITQLSAVLPLAFNLACHILLPFVLNPALMVFNY